MSAVRYLAGLAALALVLGSLGAASHAWVARLRPGWSGALARLAEVIVGLSGMICVLELLGSVSLFRFAAVVPVLTVLGLLAWWAAGRNPALEPVEREIPPTPGSPLLMRRITVVALACVAADWATRVINAYHQGMTNVDTLWYHLPDAARFVQDGSITPLHFFDLETVTAFYPATSELIHGFGILLMGNDILSPVINLGWLALAMLAAWCIGKPFGAQLITLTAVAALMVTPELATSQPGGGYDDVVGLALLLSCGGILINTHTGDNRWRLSGIGIAALAAGLAAGTKFTFLVPIVALTIGIPVVAQRGDRTKEAGVWSAFVILIGGFWYVRNWIAVGNPLPSVHLKLGPLSLPNPVITTPSSTLAHFVLRGSDWSGYFFPGFRLAFGPVWWAVLALSACGLVVTLVRGQGSMTKMLAAVGIATAVGFVVSPQYLAAFGIPVFFVDNIRYADPAIVLGLVLLPLARVFVGSRWRWALLVTFVGITLVTQLDESTWPLHLLSREFVPPIVGVDAILGALVGLCALLGGLALVGRRDIPTWHVRTASRSVAVLLVSAVIVVMGLGVQSFYLNHRYESASLQPPFGWAQSVSAARIGVAGTFTQLQYALYGRDLSNYVQYIGVRGPHGSYAPATTCAQWRRLVNAGRYNYVVTSTGSVASRKSRGIGAAFLHGLDQSRSELESGASQCGSVEHVTRPLISRPFRLSTHWTAECRSLWGTGVQECQSNSCVGGGGLTIVTVSQFHRRKY